MGVLDIVPVRDACRLGAHLDLTGYLDRRLDWRKRPQVVRLCKDEQGTWLPIGEDHRADVVSVIPVRHSRK